MKRHTSIWRGIVAGGLIAGLAALAQDANTTKLTEADYAVFAKLRFANALASQKRMFAHSDNAKEAAIAAQLNKAYADAGWTAERYEQVDDAVSSGLSALNESEHGEDPASAKEQLAAMDKTTVAVIQAHRKELSDSNGLEQRAREAMQEEVNLARRGAPPTPAELTGKWVLDVDLTVAAMTEGLPDDARKSAGDAFRQKLSAASYTFGPGDALLAVNQPPGLPPDSQKGTYRLEGSKLIIKAKMGKREREESVDIGIKDGHLRIGMMGIYSIFRKE